MGIKKTNTYIYPQEKNNSTKTDDEIIKQNESSYQGEQNSLKTKIFIISKNIFYKMISKIKKLWKVFTIFFLGASLAVKSAIIIGGIGLGVLSYYKIFKSGGITYQSSALLQYKPADKLFTTFAYIPYIDSENGYKKRDILNDKKQKIIIGYCRRDYALGIGYENVQDIILKYQKDACNSDILNSLPEPIVLSANAESSRIFGKYKTTDCAMLDLDESIRSKHFIEIMTELKQWQAISKKSKEVLSGFIRLYCFKN